MDKAPPPTHLSDLRIVQLMETHGRERRWRYFTFASYREIIANEKLDDQDGPYSLVDFSNVGNFAPYVAEDFYSDVAEFNRFTDYAFSKTGKEEGIGKEAARKRAKRATPRTGISDPTVSGKKRKRGEAGLDTLADGDNGHTPRKRGRPRKAAAQSRHNGVNAAEKDATATRDRGRSGPEESTGSVQLEGATISDDRHSPSPRVPKKRRRPPKENHSSEFVSEASVPTRRRGRPRKQPPSLPPTDETGHPPLRDIVNPFDIHATRHPISEPLPPDVNAGEAEARSTVNGSDNVLQQPGQSMQPATIRGYRSLGGPGMNMEIVDDNRHSPAQSGGQNTDLEQTRTEGPGELDTGGGTLVRMDTSPDFVDASLGMEF
jgi:hypothetical protein